MANCCCPRCKSENVVQMQNKLGYCWMCKFSNWLWTWTAPSFYHLTETRAGNCPKCGAPIYAPLVIAPCSGSLVAGVTFSCMCNIKL